VDLCRVRSEHRHSGRNGASFYCGDSSNPIHSLGFSPGTQQLAFYLSQKDIQLTGYMVSAQAQVIADISFCATAVRPLDPFTVFWVPVMAYHVVLFALFLLVGYRIYGRMWRRQRLLEMIYRASFFNFLASVHLPFLFRSWDHSEIS